MSDRLVLGCGYLGRRVAARWQALGQRVFATTRKPERAEELRSLGITPALCDVLVPASLRALPPVAALGYAVGIDRGAGRSLREVYVEGLANVLDVVAAWPRLPRFVYVSSTSVYGQTDGSEVDESAPTEPLEEAGRVTLEAEQLLRRRLPEAIVLRFAGIYGPGRLIRAQVLRAGEPIVADGEKWLNLIHVEDGAESVIAAVERGEVGTTYNVSDDRPVRRRDFYGRLAELLGAAPPRFEAPTPGEAANRRLVNRRMREGLGVVPRYPSYEEGLAAC